MVNFEASKQKERKEFVQSFILFYIVPFIPNERRVMRNEFLYIIIFVLGI